MGEGRVRGESCYYKVNGILRNNQKLNAMDFERTREEAVLKVLCHRGLGPRSRLIAAKP